MKRASQTYLLPLTSREFEQITLAIMLQSNKAHKLQGFGQCIARWLDQWSTGELAVTKPRHTQDIDALRGSTHQIYVGLSGETIQLFKTWRSAFVGESDLPVAVKAAIMKLVVCFLAQHRSETA